MATQAELIRIALDKARQDWSKYTDQKMSEIYDLYSEAYKSIEIAIIKATRGGNLPPARLVHLLNEVKQAMDNLRVQLRRSIRKYQKESVESSIKGIIASLEGKVSVNIKVAVSDATWSKMNADAMDALMKINFGGITFSRRVWDNVWPIERQIRNRIQTAVMLGDSAYVVARDIRKYLGTSKTLRGKALLDYHPGSGVYKSGFSNAVRLARTELNRAFNEGIIRYGLQKDWVDGFIWRVASGNPCEDCQDEDGVFFPADEAPYIPLHPNCMCYLEIHIADSANLANE